MTTAAKQKVIRDGTLVYALKHRIQIFRKQEADSEPNLTPQNALPGPSTLAELAEALRDPLPPPPLRPRCYDALEAMANWKPLTREMVHELLVKKRDAQEALLEDYAKRTGQQVALCDYCDLGVTEEEEEDGWGTVVTPTKCQECDGLGVVKI